MKMTQKRLLFENKLLLFNYKCIDTENKYNSLILDLQHLRTPVKSLIKLFKPKLSGFT